MSGPMFGKTSIKALEEYCLKNWLPFPDYKVRPAPDGSLSFICTVTVAGEKAEGVGGSKRKAEREAAANLMEKLEGMSRDAENIPQDDWETAPIGISDSIGELRAFCIQKNLPLPTFEIVDRAGPPEAPQFTFECKVGTTEQRGTASTQLVAKQLVAREHLKALRKPSATEMPKETGSVDQLGKQLEKLNLQDSVLVRQNYFENLELAKRTKALQIIDDKSITCSKNKVEMIMKALQIPYRIYEIPSTIGLMVFVELDCEIDTVIAGEKEAIFNHLVEYFYDMLH